MFGRILQLIAICGLMLGTSQPVFAQAGLAGSAAGGVGASSAAAAPTTLWRFLGFPQGVQRVRDVLTNRRGNRPRMERKDPMKRIADPANLESDTPAIKKAAEIKQAEDMKMQKIKAIKYLAKVGCGCYDKDGEITAALVAATDDCTPDVREAAIEAIEDAANGECCRKCGSTSCCNEEITKRLSEMAYERDDTGCPIEPNADIRELAAKVLKRCCPGGPPRGPIEEEIDEETDDSVELIPAPEGAKEESQLGESGEAGEDPIGEGDESDEMDFDDTESGDAESNDQFQDNPFEDGSEDSDDLSLSQPTSDAEVHFRFDDAGATPPEGQFPNRSLNRFRIPTPANPRVKLPAPTRGVSQSSMPQSVRPTQSSAIDQIKPVVIPDPVSISPLPMQTSSPLQATAVSDVPISPRVIQVAVQKNRQEIKIRPIAKSAPPTDQGFTNVKPAPVPKAGQNQVVGRVISVNLNSGHLILEGPNLRTLSRKMQGDLYRSTSQGSAKITGITVVRVEDELVRVRVANRPVLGKIQLGDQAVFH